MIRTKLRYHAPTSVPAAVQLLTEHRGRVAVLGGGTILVPMMSRGERNVDHLVDLAQIGLDAITRDGDWLVIGARTTYAAAIDSEPVARAAPLLACAARGITGGAQLRNQATIGGSACLANPASEIPAVLVALRARMSIAGPDGLRHLSAAKFFTGAFATALDDSEFLTGISVPIQEARFGYYKLKHCEGSWPIATAAATLGAGRYWVTLGGVADTPVRLPAEPEDDLDDRVRAAIPTPWADQLAPASYRRDVAPAVARRALSQLGGPDE
jgi:aerobic carbon-monoxide dehydrogenase medium subunit